MTLQSRLMKKFQEWQPSPLETVEKSKSHVTLSCQQEEFQFLEGDLLYKIEKKEKLPPWVVVYCGSQTRKKIDYLAPCSPHRFRLKVILKASAVPFLVEKSINFYGNEQILNEKFGLNIVLDENSEGKGDFIENGDVLAKIDDKVSSSKEVLVVKKYIEANHEKNKHINKEDVKSDIDTTDNKNQSIDGSGDVNVMNEISDQSSKHRWLESQWSEESWASTESDGTSATCFSMAVRGGYLKQMQMMLDERPALIGIINSINGFTPLATAIRKGDLNTVRYLVSCGADVNQQSSTGQSPLQLAVLMVPLPIAELLMDRGADITARDRNGLRVEHYAADSCDVEMMELVLRRGGDLHVKDHKGWTPLFRAVCQGASPAMVELLVSCGSDVTVMDRAGLSLASAARVIQDSHGRTRDAIIRLVDKQYPYELALANFTRLTKKISRVHTLFKTS